MATRGMIIKQIEEDIHRCQMGNGQIYDIEIFQYAGKKIGVEFTFHRSSKGFVHTIHTEESGSFDAIVHNAY